MIGKEQRVPEIVWQTLSADEKEVCYAFSVGDWQSGYGSWYIESGGIPSETLKNMIEKGLIEMKTAQELAQEYVDAHKLEVENIHAKKVGKITDEDRILLSNYSTRELIIRDKVDDPRYRLYSAEFHQYSLLQLEQAE